VANGLDPYRYLRHVFEVTPTLRASEELQQLLLWNIILGDGAVWSALAA
jgi:IS66 C-terminal element